MKWSSFLRQPMRHESACLDDGMAIAVRDKEELTFARADLGVDDLVAEISAGKTRRATGFVVGGRFCRFVSVPWSDHLLDSESVNLHYRNAFADVFGDVASGTLFAAADEPHGQARVVCALENGLIEALRAWAVRHGRQVAFVRPAVQVAFEFFRQQMQGEAGVFALREPTVLSLLC